MNNKKVSIIITCYNYGRFVADAINSALAQTYDNIEVIVVNDGSIDNSDEVIRKFNDRIIYINQENCGAAKARNNGIEVASGEYCICLDADDWISSDYIKDAVSIMEDYTIISPNVHVCDSSLSLTGKIWGRKRINPNTLKKEILIKNIVMSSCFMFSKKLWKEIGGYDNNAPRAEDWIFCIDLVFAGCVVKYLNIDNVYFKYRKHGPSRVSSVGGNTVLDYVYKKYGIFKDGFNRLEKIKSLYRLVLEREADNGGLNHYLKSDLTIVGILHQLYNSREYKKKFIGKYNKNEK